MAENAALDSPFISYGSPEELPPPGSLQNQLEGISLHPWEVQHEHCPLKQIPLTNLGCPSASYVPSGEECLPVQWLFSSNLTPPDPELTNRSMPPNSSQLLLWR